MSSENAVLESLKESFEIVRKSKKFFPLIFALQIVFFVLIFMAVSFYSVNIIESSKEVMLYFDEINVDPQRAGLKVLQEENPLGDDPLLIRRNYDEILTNSYYMILFTFVIFILVNGFMWYLSFDISNTKKEIFVRKEMLNYFLKFLVASVLLFFSGGLFFYSLFQIAFSEFLLSEPKKFIPLAVVSLVSFYFAFTSIPLLGSIKPSRKDFKKLAKEVFRIGTKKVVPLLASYILVGILIILATLLIFYFTEKNLFLLLASILLFFFVFAWGRVFLTKLVNRLSSFS